MRRIAVLSMLVASPACAHAILVDSTPAPNAHIKPGPLAITMRYNSRIDAARSKLTLAVAGQAPQRLDAAASGEDAMQANTTVAHGDYILRWQVLALDGHITRGDVPFTVDAP
jgi:methionine-rich copper-binding protein CopC